jgi:hypothetical protein
MLADLRAPSVKDVGAASEFGIDREPFQVTLAESEASVSVGSSDPSANKPGGSCRCARQCRSLGIQRL